MKVGVIGAGFSGLASAAILAKDGHDVHIYEKHDVAGGRARHFTSQGFHFDMGPSWYWMPDVFEKFFARFGHAPSDFYELIKLDPAFRVFLEGDEAFDVPADFESMVELFELRESGAGQRLRKFMQEAEFKYKLGIDELVYKPGKSWLEFMSPAVIKGAARLDVLVSMRAHVGRFFADPGLIALMEFPVLFLGAMPDSTPALYSLMNYAGYKLGTFYPLGGFSAVVAAMQRVAEQEGVHLHFGAEVEEVICAHGSARALVMNGEPEQLDAVVASADYHHVETKLLPQNQRRYSDKYWRGRTLAPSCLIYYLGLNQTIDQLAHHNLFFDADLNDHAAEIYTQPKWPCQPLFYVSCPSKTDPHVAPEGHENMFILMPIAPGLDDGDEIREAYFQRMIKRIEKRTGTSIMDSIIVKRSYCVTDFKRDYNALRGNAYGLANTLRQTAVLKPKIQHHSLRNLVYAGHLTVPGPGVPPALISGQIAASTLLTNLNSQQ